MEALGKITKMYQRWPVSRRKFEPGCGDSRLQQLIWLETRRVIKVTY